MLVSDPSGNITGVSNVVLSTFTSSAVVVWLMQLIKKSKWLTFVEEGKPALNRFVSVVAAAAANLGLSYTWDAQTHALTIAGLSVAGMLAMGWHWLNHYAMQETIYQMAVNKPTAPSLSQQATLVQEKAQTVAVSPEQASIPATK